MQTILNIIGIIFFYNIVAVNTTVVYHPVHLSVINFEYVENEEIFSLSVRVFTDDFQSVINMEQGVNIKITEANIKETKKYIDKYIRDHVKIYFNKNRIFQNTDSHNIKIDSSENTTEIFYSFKQKVPKKVKIENTLFSAYFKDQKNLFIFTCENTQEAFKFDRNNTESEFSLK